MMFHQTYCPKREMLVERNDTLGHKRINAYRET